MMDDSWIKPHGSKKSPTFTKPPKDWARTTKPTKTGQPIKDNDVKMVRKEDREAPKRTTKPLIYAEDPLNLMQAQLESLQTRTTINGRSIIKKLP